MAMDVSVNNVSKSSTLPPWTGEYLFQYGVALYNSHAQDLEGHVEDPRLKGLTWVDVLKKAITSFKEGESNLDAALFLAKCLNRGEGMYHADLIKMRQEKLSDNRKLDDNEMLVKVFGNPFHPLSLITHAAGQGHIQGIVEFVKRRIENFSLQFTDPSPSKMETIYSMLKEYQQREEKIDTPDISWFDYLIQLLRNVIVSRDRIAVGQYSILAEGYFLLGELLLKKSLAKTLLAAGVQEKDVRHWVSFPWTLSHHATNWGDLARCAIEFCYIESYPEILSLWHEAAQLGNVEAKYNLAAFEDHGIATVGEYSRRCCQQMLRRGSECPSRPQDLRTGIADPQQHIDEMFREAAQQGVFHAQLALACSRRSKYPGSISDENCYLRLQRNINDEDSGSWRRICELRGAAVCSSGTCSELALVRDKTVTSSMNLSAPRLWRDLRSLDLNWRPLHQQVDCTYYPHSVRDFFLMADEVFQSNDPKRHQSLLTVLHVFEQQLSHDECSLGSTSTASASSVATQPTVHSGLRWIYWNLAFCYLEGFGVPSHIGKAIHFLKEAERFGDAEAAFLLGDWYFSGAHHLAIDFEKAERYWIQSLLNGEMLAYLPLALLSKSVEGKVDLYLALLNKVEREVVLLGRDIQNLIEVSWICLSFYSSHPYFQSKVSMQIAKYFQTISANIYYVIHNRQHEDTKEGNGESNEVAHDDAQDEGREDEKTFPLNKKIKINHVTEQSCPCLICDAARQTACLTLLYSHNEHIEIEPETSASETNQLPSVMKISLPNISFGKMKKVQNLTIPVSLSRIIIVSTTNVVEDILTTDVILVPINKIDLQEIKGLMALSRECSQHFLCCFGHYQSKENPHEYFLVMKKPIDCCNLHTLLRNMEARSRTRPGPALSLRVTWMLDILYGLNELHLRGLCHGNLSLASVWISGDYFQVKLNLSLRDRDNTALHFQAPEITNNPNDSIATPKSDLYAIAMIFACIMRGRVFGERGNDLEQLHGASSSRQSLQVLQHRFIDETIDHMQIFYDEISRSLISSNIYTLIDFFRKCTEEDPKKRMKLMDCVFVLRKLKDLCVPVDTTIERRKLKTLL